VRALGAARDRAASLHAGALVLTHARAAGAAAHDIEARFAQSALLAAIAHAAQARRDDSQEEDEALALLLAA
jgi:hypothetical protein